MTKKLEIQNSQFLEKGANDILQSIRYLLRKWVMKMLIFAEKGESIENGQIMRAFYQGVCLVLRVSYFQGSNADRGIRLPKTLSTPSV